MSLKKKSASNVARGCNIKTRFDGISEYISRRGRTKLLKVLREKFDSYERIAELLNVNKTTVHRWLNHKRIHPSNEKTEILLSIAEEIEPEKAELILLEEKMTFLKFLVKELNDF